MVDLQLQVVPVVQAEAEMVQLHLQVLAQVMMAQLTLVAVVVEQENQEHSAVVQVDLV